MILLYLLVAFAALRLLVSFTNLITRQWLRSGAVKGNPRVSVLIPARNEERNMARLLRSLTDEVPGMAPVSEILVYDDLSTDNTTVEVERVMAELGARNPIRLIRGGALPEGWLGKNHACHRLAGVAVGDWLLFLDADVEVEPQLIRDAVAYAQKKNLRLLSLFPTQRMVTAGEWMVVPLMNWILVTLLPLILVRTCRWTSFSAANGQFMLFDAKLYRRFRWHEQVKSDPVEDILISRLMKKKRFRTATLLSGGQVSCRMYGDYNQAVSGFSKNLGQFFGNSLIWMLIFLLLTNLLPLIFIVFFIPSMLPEKLLLVGIYFALILLIRMAVSLLSRQNVLRNLLFWIPQQVVLILLMWKSVTRRFGRTVEWKGRQV